MKSQQYGLRISKYYSSRIVNTVTGGDRASTETNTPTKRRYGPKPSGVSGLPVTPEMSGRRISGQRTLASSKIGGHNKQGKLFSGVGGG